MVCLVLRDLEAGGQVVYSSCALKGYGAQNASDPARVPRSLEGEAVIGSQKGPRCR